MPEKVMPTNPELKGLVELKANIPYAAPEGKELCLQLLKPQWSSGGAGFPLVGVIQGSAWQKPNQFAKLPQLSRLAERGYVIASVTHRSCWEAAAPAFLQDVKSALRFLRAHAEEYDIDKERVCAWGTSSGGNTALLLGLTGDDPAFEGEDYAGESTCVQAVVDCFGPTDVNKMIDVQYADKPKTVENTFYALGGCNPDTYHETLRQVSPVTYVTPGRALPPFLILHGDADALVLYEDSEDFYNMLVEQGYEADLVHVTNAPHEGNFWSLPLLEIIFDFIQKNQA